MMKLKWEILIGILAMLIGIVFIGWYMSEFQSDYAQNETVYAEGQNSSEDLGGAGKAPQADTTAIDTSSESDPIATSGAITQTPGATLTKGSQETDSSLIGSLNSESDATEVTTTETTRVDGQQGTGASSAEDNSVREAIEASKSQQSETVPASAANDQEYSDNPSSRLQGDDPGLGEWSEGRFVGKINKDQTHADLSSSMSIRDEISKALQGHKKPVDPAEDAYFSTIAKESSVLTVTTAHEDKDLKFTRNTKQPTANEKTEEIPITDGLFVIKPGESLSAIAHRLYRDPNAYARIYELNKDIISDPNHIQVGQKIRLPAP